MPILAISFRPSRLVVIGLLTLLAVGCSGVPQIEPASQSDTAMLPTLEINPDLVKTFRPSNDRDWQPQQAQLPEADILGNEVMVRNIRHCTYRSMDDFDVDYYDKTLDLESLESVDYIMIPFSSVPGVGHTMLSFGFDDGYHLAVSVETRKEKGEGFSTWKGFLRQFELIYVLGDERDLIQLRANHELDSVYVYRTTATPEQSRELFLDVMGRINKLAAKPEFYNTLTNNCTTNIRDHINQIRPNRVPYDYRVLLPGYSDRLAYELGLLDTDLPFEQLKQRARVNYLAYQHRESADFSRKIRR